MRNKIIAFSIVTVACLVAWVVGTFAHFKNVKIPDFLGGFSLGMGSVFAIALIYQIVISFQPTDSLTKVN